MSRVNTIRSEIALFLAEVQLKQSGPERLRAAVSSSILAPGKRVRSVLLVLTGEALGGPRRAAVEAAGAVEMIHAASLILDDLPTMDDAKIRRGQPSLHRAFDEPTAILAAIDLMNCGFGVLAGLSGCPAEARADAVRRMSKAVGGMGLVGGQVRDLFPVDQPSLSDVEATHAGKTGALFAAALALGGVVAGKPDETVERLWTAGMDVGLAFQGYDDLLDRHAVAADIGKDTGIDAGKATLASVLGRHDAEQWCRMRLDAVQDGLAEIGLGGSDVTGYISELADMLARPLAPARAVSRTAGAAE